MKRQKVYRTDDTILVVTAHTDGCAGKPYVSVTAEKVESISLEDAKDSTYEYWYSFFEENPEELGKTLAEWWGSLDHREHDAASAAAQLVIDTDGELHGFDQWSREFDLDGVPSVFHWVSGGCSHKAIQAATNEFDRLIELHLNREPGAIAEAEAILSSWDEVDAQAEAERIAREVYNEDQDTP